MKLASVTADNKALFGAIDESGGFIDLTGAFPQFATLSDAAAAGALGLLAKAAETRTASHVAGRFTYESPLPHPEKIICVGVNFPNRNDEYKDGQKAPENMSLFIRFARSFTGHGQPLIRPPETHQLDYEGEIAVVIGKAGRRIPEVDALHHVSAITLCNEGTLRDWVRHAKFNVTQGKNWERSGAMGPWLVPFTDAGQLEDIRLTTHVNGEVRQDDRTANMLFPIRQQIAYISTFTTLMPGDIIITGTPTGAGARFDPPRFLKPGDEVTVTAEGIGSLHNTVRDE